jgi:hypothetical protein
MAIRLRSFIKEVTFDHEVGGEPCSFRPVSPKVFVENLVAFKALMAIGSRLLASDPITHAESHETRGDTTTTIVSPPDLRMVEQLKATRATDVQSFLDNLGKKELRLALARIITDSTRDQDLYLAPDDVLLSWIDDPNMNFAILVDLLLGVWKANKETFSPLVARVRGLLAPHLKRVVPQPVPEMEPMS